VNFRQASPEIDTEQGPKPGDQKGLPLRHVSGPKSLTIGYHSHILAIYPSQKRDQSGTTPLLGGLQAARQGDGSGTGAVAKGRRCGEYAPNRNALRPDWVQKGCLGCPIRKISS
jgi:hypothetical protein